MAFKRSKPGIKSRAHSRPTPKDKLKTEKFRAALDGSFEDLRVSAATTKLSPKTNSAGVKKNRTNRQVVGKAEIDAQIDQLTRLMK